MGIAAAACTPHWFSKKRGAWQEISLEVAVFMLLGDPF